MIERKIKREINNTNLECSCNFGIILNDDIEGQT